MSPRTRKIKYMRFALWTLLSCTLYALSFPPIGIPEFAYLFAVPLFLGLEREALSPKRKLAITYCLQTLTWLALLMWIRHVTWAGLITVSLILAIFPTLFSALSLHFLKKNSRNTFIPLLALPSLWILLEWLRSWIGTGFLWLPLSASQWERPFLLSIAPFTGAYGISFILILTNVAITQWILQRPKHITLRPTLGILTSLGLIALAGFCFLSAPSPTHTQTFHIGIVQPDTNPHAKWDIQKAWVNYQHIEELTASLADTKPPLDLILWPETANFFPLIGDPLMLSTAEQLVHEIRTPLISGTLAYYNDRWYNAAALITPKSGLYPQFYAKQKRVPGGEFVPFKDLLPWLETVIPAIAVEAGQSPTLLPVEGYDFAPLICYEDIFPQLSRQATLQGAECLLVLTNNAWHGTEAGAYQHAAHSVLRAAENRRPLVRCGNAGWSGVINPRGAITDILTDDDQSIYTSMTQVVEVPLSKDAPLSFYTRYGDYFVALCATLLAFALTISYTRNNKPHQ